jgi:ribonuclease HII
MILGVDEVGRGPWAGPLVVGAVVLGGAEIGGLADSKKLSKKRREELSTLIHDQAAAVALGWVSAIELDEIGMSEALRLATRRAVEQIKTPYHEIILDGTVNYLKGTTLEMYVTTMPKADALVPSVSAASIVAKVARDAYMAEQDATYPGYGFAKNAGYGVAAHRQAIEKLGVTLLHRLSFVPLMRYRQTATDTQSIAPDRIAKTTKSIGNASETVVCNYLKSHNYEIVGRNWRTRWCEIDIIAHKHGTLYFVEVKHRKNDKAGDGLAAITPKKLKQMTFAAELYAVTHGGPNLQLAVASTTGEPPQLVEFLQLT